MHVSICEVVKWLFWVSEFHLLPAIPTPSLKTHFLRTVCKPNHCCIFLFLGNAIILELDRLDFSQHPLTGSIRRSYYFLAARSTSVQSGLELLLSLIRPLELWPPKPVKRTGWFLTVVPCSLCQCLAVTKSGKYDARIRDILVRHAVFGV